MFNRVGDVCVSGVGACETVRVCAAYCTAACVKPDVCVSFVEWVVSAVLSWSAVELSCLGFGV